MKHRHRIDPAETDLLVLDVHGVVFNNPLTAFLYRLGIDTAEGGRELLERWRNDVRIPFWEGRIGEDELWHLLAPDLPADRLRQELEGRYATGPLFELVTAWPNRLWLLSNHRTDWLTDRLERFGITGSIDELLVSDALGTAKPKPGAFDAVRDAARETTVFFVDDQPANVTTARQLGIPAGVIGSVDTDLRPTIRART